MLENRMEERNTQTLSKATKIRNWYGRYERSISSASLILGFVFDAVTLKRVDLFWENFWVIAHLLIVGACIVLVHAVEKDEGDESNPSKVHFWLVNVLQFFFGGILSTYLVFYFRSSDIFTSWPFILILALSFASNEILKRHFVRLSFQISQFFLSVFCFAIFLVPVLLHKIGSQIFILSGICSLVVIFLFLLLVRFVAKDEFGKNKKIMFAAIAGIFVVINVLYFTNILPPIPLSLKEAGVYYSIKRNAQGDYVVVADKGNWSNFFRLYPDFHALAGEPVFVYSAVFSPSGLNITVIHEWQREDPLIGKWVSVTQVPLNVAGGRDGGFRTYSEKKTNLVPGLWRVNVRTAQGQVIGRIRFNIVSADGLPKVDQKINN